VKFPHVECLQVHWVGFFSHQQIIGAPQLSCCLEGLSKSSCKVLYCCNISLQSTNVFYGNQTMSLFAFWMRQREPDNQWIFSAYQLTSSTCTRK
jgi:hypothetical protein